MMYFYYLGVSSTKLKGVAYLRGLNHPDYHKVWDVADYVYPANLESSVAVITNAVITPLQTPSFCPADPEVGPLCDCPERECKSQCVPNRAEPTGNGVRTGNCVPSAADPEVKVCEIEGWCPVEIDTLPTKGVLIDEAVNFTLFIRSTMEFKKYGFMKRNILDPETIRNCHYSSTDNVYCPIFRIGDMLERAGVKFEDIAKYGGILGIFLTWDCNLDYSWDDCHPKYSFKRLDDPESGGHNFRYANFYRQNGTQYRDLIKAYGIRFDIIVEGTGRKFDIIVLVNSIASGLALLVIASIVCDFLIIYVVDNRHFYKNQKISVVSEEIEEQSSTSYGTLESSKTPHESAGK